MNLVHIVANIYLRMSSSNKIVFNFIAISGRINFLLGAISLWSNENKLEFVIERQVLLHQNCLVVQYVAC